MLQTFMCYCEKGEKMKRVFVIEFKNGMKKQYLIDMWNIFIGETLACVEAVSDDRKYWFDTEEIKYCYTSYDYYE